MDKEYSFLKVLVNFVSANWNRKTEMMRMKHDLKMKELILRFNHEERLAEIKKGQNGN